MLKRGRSAKLATTNMIYFGTAIAEVQCQLLYKTKRTHMRLLLVSENTAATDFKSCYLCVLG